jgi:hypothetical protein
MPSFRQRPVTWLFWLATACLDLLAVSTDYRSHWFAILALAQVVVVGGWLALGRAHRLARAGAFITMILAMTAPDKLLGPAESSDWRWVLGALIGIGSLTATAALIELELLTALGAIKRRKTPWRFSVVELLGWMIVVAVAATAWREANFRSLTGAGPDPTWGDLLCFAAISASAMIAGLRVSGRASFILGLAAAIGVCLLAVRYGQRPVSNAAEIVGAFAYVVAWVFVQRLDESSQSTHPTAGSAALDDQRADLGD